MTGFAPERRQLLKAGVWTVPAIAVATAAPAFAASGADMSTSSGVNPQPFTTDIWDFRLVANLRLRNSGSASTTALTVTFTIPSGVGNFLISNMPAAWSPTVLGATQIRFTAPAQLAAGAQQDVAFRVGRPSNGSDTVSAVVNPGGAGISGAITGSV